MVTKKAGSEQINNGKVALYQRFLAIAHMTNSKTNKKGAKLLVAFTVLAIALVGLAITPAFATESDADQAKESVNVFEIEDADDLFEFAKNVNEGNQYSKSVKLTADIDLEGRSWDPIGQTGYYGGKVGHEFTGTFDGNGKTIYNMTIDKWLLEEDSERGNAKTNDFASGFFGYIGSQTVIKNVTFKNADVSGHHWVGVVAGYMTGTIENCKVIDSTVTNTYHDEQARGDKTGAIVGVVNSESQLISCTAENSIVSGACDTGQIAGCVTIWSTLKDCGATDVVVKAALEDGGTGKNVAEDLVGRYVATTEKPDGSVEYYPDVDDITGKNVTLRDGVVFEWDPLNEEMEFTGTYTLPSVGAKVTIGKGIIFKGTIKFSDTEVKFDNSDLRTEELTIEAGSLTISGTIKTGTNLRITTNGEVILDGVDITSGGDNTGLTISTKGTDDKIVIKNLSVEKGAVLQLDENTSVEGTLKVAGKVEVADGKTLTVEEKAKLVVEGQVDVSAGGELVNDGTIQITDSKAELPDVVGGDGSVDSSSVASEGTLSGEYNTNTTFTQNQTITVTADTYLIGETVFVVEGKLIIPEGVTLYIQEDARLVVSKSTGYLENNGTIVVESKVDAMRESDYGGGKVPKTLIPYAGALAIVNGIVENNGTIELAYAEEALDKANYNNHVSMNNSGTLVNNGEIIVGEDSFLYMWNGFANLGSFTLSGKIMADNGASIINSGIVTLNGTIDMNGAGNGGKVLKIDLKTTDAIVDIVSLAQDDDIDYAGLVVCANELETPSSSKTYEGTPAVSLKANNGFATEGLKVTVTLVADKTDTTKSYRTLVLSGDVSFSTDLTSYSGTAPVVISTTGNTLVDEALDLSAGVELAVGGPMTVSGTMTSVNDKVLGGNDLGKIIATGTITVAGSIVSNEKIGDNTKINAAYYSTSKTTTSSETNTYTTLDKAVSAGATKIEMLGENTVSADVTIPSGTTVTVSGETTVGSEVTLTFASGSVLKGTADITVTGTLYVEDKKTALKNSGDIESDVTKDGEKDRTYTNITIALAGAKAGDVVKISKDVTISKNTVIPAGVELDTDGDNKITVKNDVTLTVEGTLFLNEGTLELKDRVDETESAAAEEAGKLELNGVVKSTSSIDALKIVGAYYTITDKIDTYYYVQPVADAAGLISTVDGAEIAIKSWGTDLAIGDVSFMGTADKKVTVTVEGKLSAGTITIDNASVEFGSDAFIGKITDSVGTITLNGTADGFTVASATSDSTKTFSITGKFTAGSKKVTLEGTSTVKEFTSGNVVVDGDITVKGTTATEVENLTVNGTVVVENEVTLRVKKNLNILGSVDAKVATSTSGAGNVSAKNVYIGLTEKAVTGAAASASGSFTISEFLYVADGSSIPAKLVDNKKSLQVFVEDKLWMTIYAMDDTDLTIKITEIPVEDVTLDSWTDEKGEKVAEYDGDITINNNKVYAKIIYDVYDVKIIVCSGIDNVYIDGVLAGETTKVAAGEHTMSYTLANGYTGTATMLVNGEKVTGYKFTASGAFSDDDAEPEYKITLQGIEASEPTTPVTPVQPIVSSDDDDMGLTEYLLIVLVILAAILVVVVAIRMMRS